MSAVESKAGIRPINKGSDMPTSSCKDQGKVLTYLSRYLALMNWHRYFGWYLINSNLYRVRKLAAALVFRAGYMLAQHGVNCVEQFVLIQVFLNH